MKKRIFTLMKTLTVLFATFVFTACSNTVEVEDETSNEKVDLFSNYNQQEALTKMQQLITQFIEIRNELYDKENDYIDLDSLDARLLSYNSNLITRSISKENLYSAPNPIVDWDVYAKEVLSADAYEIFYSYISKGKLSKEDVDEMKTKISKLQISSQERAYIEGIFQMADMIENELSSANDKYVTRRAPNALACNIVTEIGATAAGAIWGAALGGGPVGAAAIALGWGIAGTIAAYYKC